MRNVRVSITIILFFASSALLNAQPGDGGGDPDVPISGIEILIGLGGLYGLRKAYIARRKKE